MTPTHTNFSSWYLLRCFSVDDDGDLANVVARTPGVDIPNEHVSPPETLDFLNGEENPLDSVDGLRLPIFDLHDFFENES